MLEDRAVDVPAGVGRAALGIALAADRSRREGRPVAVDPPDGSPLTG
jgi:hypothetical protein